MILSEASEKIQQRKIQSERRKCNIKEQLVLQSLVIPGLIFLAVFSYIPLMGIVIAFQDYDLFLGVRGSTWVGFKQFIDFFGSNNFLKIMRNTLSISFLKLIFGFPMPIILAILFNEIGKIKIKKAFQTITYLPYFIAWVVVSGMIISLLAVNNGTVNNFLISLGLINEPVNFLSKPEYFWPILVISNIWKGSGYGAIIYMAAIAGINPELYEAASIDGATRFRSIFVVTLPCIIPQVAILLILNISNILNTGMEDILLLTNNGDNAILNGVSEVIDTFVYRYGVKLQRYSYATAVGLFKTVVNVAMLFSANSIIRKLTDTSIW